MQDSVPYLLARLEQGVATEQDITSLRTLLKVKCEMSMKMPTELYDTLVQYIDDLEEKQRDE